MERIQNRYFKLEYDYFFIDNFYVNDNQFMTNFLKHILPITSI